VIIGVLYPSVSWTVFTAAVTTSDIQLHLCQPYQEPHHSQDGSPVRDRLMQCPEQGRERQPYRQEHHRRSRNCLRDLEQCLTDLGEHPQMRPSAVPLVIVNGYRPPWTSSESNSKMRPAGRPGTYRAAWATAEVQP
jgi:hypothetical protein